MIKLTGVSKKLGEFELNDIDLDIPDGYICGLAGLNGAGKTTLINLILGLYTPDTGSIVIDDLKYPDDNKEIKNMTGCVMTDELFDPGISCLRNADHYGSFFSEYDQNRYLGYLKDFEIDPARRFELLSKGEQLKCQFAFALSVSPKYLILDEPSANFDPQFHGLFWNILQDFIRDGNRTVLLATHMTDELDRMADYLIYLDNGKVIYSGDIEQFRQKYRIVAGDLYKVKQIDPRQIIHMETGSYGASCLLKYNKYVQLPEELVISHPTIEEFMYHYSKRQRI